MLFSAGGAVVYMSVLSGDEIGFPLVLGGVGGFVAVPVAFAEFQLEARKTSLVSALTVLWVLAALGTFLGLFQTMYTYGAITYDHYEGYQAVGRLMGQVRRDPVRYLFQFAALGVPFAVASGCRLRGKSLALQVGASLLATASLSTLLLSTAVGGADAKLTLFMAGLAAVLLPPVYRVADWVDRRLALRARP
jgi:hypothetical protein